MEPVPDDAEEVDGGRFGLLSRGSRVAGISERGLIHVDGLEGSCGLGRGNTKTVGVSAISTCIDLEGCV